MFTLNPSINPGPLICHVVLGLLAYEGTCNLGLLCKCSKLNLLPANAPCMLITHRASEHELKVFIKKLKAYCHQHRLQIGLEVMVQLHDFPNSKDFISLCILLF